MTICSGPMCTRVSSNLRLRLDFGQRLCEELIMLEMGQHQGIQICRYWLVSKILGMILVSDHQLHPLTRHPPIFPTPGWPKVTKSGVRCGGGDVRSSVYCMGRSVVCVGEKSDHRGEKPEAHRLARLRVTPGRNWSAVGTTLPWLKPKLVDCLPSRLFTKIGQPFRRL